MIPYIPGRCSEDGAIQISGICGNGFCVTPVADDKNLWDMFIRCDCIGVVFCFTSACKWQEVNDDCWWRMIY